MQPCNGRAFSCAMAGAVAIPVCFECPCHMHAQMHPQHLSACLSSHISAPGCAGTWHWRVADLWHGVPEPPLLMPVSCSMSDLSPRDCWRDVGGQTDCQHVMHLATAVCCLTRVLWVCQEDLCVQSDREQPTKMLVNINSHMMLTADGRTHTFSLPYCCISSAPSWCAADA